MQTGRMPELQIDTSQVPPEKLKDPRFLVMLADTRMRLSDPQEIKAICIHEVTHGIYLARAGMVDFEFAGPRIEYDASTDTFDRTGASVKGGSIDREHLAKMSVIQWLGSVAKAFAGSGLAVKVLMPDRPDSGDFGDRENFQKFFAETIQPKYPKLKLNLDSLWKQARESVKADLETPDLPYPETIIRAADEIERMLFNRT